MSDFTYDYVTQTISVGSGTLGLGSPSAVRFETPTLSLVGTTSISTDQEQINLDARLALQGGLNVQGATYINGLKLPDQDGTEGQILATSGTGLLEFIDPPSGGSGGSLNLDNNPIVGTLDYGSGPEAQQLIVWHNSDPNYARIEVGTGLQANTIYASTIMASIYDPTAPTSINPVFSQPPKNAMESIMSGWIGEITAGVVYVNRDGPVTVTLPDRSSMDSSAQSLEITLLLHNTNNGAVTWPAEVIWAAPPELTTEANGWDVVKLTFDGSGMSEPYVKYIGYHVGKPSSGGGGATIDDATLMLNSMIFG